MTYNYEDGASAGDARYVRLSSVEYPDGRNVFYIYPSSGIADALSRVEAIAGDAAGATRFAEYAYLGAGTIVSVAHPAVTNGLTLDYNPSGNADGNPNDNYSGWDRFGRVIDQRWTDGAGTADLDRYSYTYDGNSNRTSRTNLVETNGVLDEDYTYDGLNRLVDTNRNGTDLQSWNLDSLGNWSSFTDEGTTETRTHNAANEIQNISSTAVPPEDAVSPEFDAAGNMISGPRPDDPLVRQHYIYDAWNRLVEVRADNPDNSGNPGDAIATFEYDGRNFRIGKTVGGVLEAFYYNEGQQLLETQVDGAATEEYVWDLRYIDAPILRATPGEVLYYANDANFNVTALIDAATGLVVERYHYDPYGEVLFMDADWTPRAASAFDNAVLYTGRQLDAETGLFYYRARYYDVALGRFIGRDPIGYADGMNLHAYVGSRPTNAVDPSGTDLNSSILTAYLARAYVQGVMPFFAGLSGSFEDVVVGLDDDGTVRRDTNWKRDEFMGLAALNSIPHDDKWHNVRAGKYINSTRIGAPLVRVDAYVLNDTRNFYVKGRYSAKVCECTPTTVGGSVAGKWTIQLKNANMDWALCDEIDANSFKELYNTGQLTTRNWFNSFGDFFGNIKQLAAATLEGTGDIVGDKLFDAEFGVLIKFNESFTNTRTVPVKSTKHLCNDGNGT